MPAGKPIERSLLYLKGLRLDQDTAPAEQVGGSSTNNSRRKSKNDSNDEPVIALDRLANTKATKRSLHWPSYWDKQLPEVLGEDHILTHMIKTTHIPQVLILANLRVAYDKFLDDDYLLRFEDFVRTFNKLKPLLLIAGDQEAHTDLLFDYNAYILAFKELKKCRAANKQGRQYNYSFANTEHANQHLRFDSGYHLKDNWRDVAKNAIAWVEKKLRLETLKIPKCVAPFFSAFIGEWMHQHADDKLPGSYYQASGAAVVINGLAYLGGELRRDTLVYKANQFKVNRGTLNDALTGIEQLLRVYQLDFVNPKVQPYNAIILRDVLLFWINIYVVFAKENPKMVGAAKLPVCKSLRSLLSRIDNGLHQGECLSEFASIYRAGIEAQKAHKKKVLIPGGKLGKLLILVAKLLLPTVDLTAANNLVLSCIEQQRATEVEEAEAARLPVATVIYNPEIVKQEAIGTQADMPSKSMELPIAVPVGNRVSNQRLAPALPQVPSRIANLTPSSKAGSSQPVSVSNTDTVAQTNSKQVTVDATNSSRFTSKATAATACESEAQQSSGDEQLDEVGVFNDQVWPKVSHLTPLGADSDAKGNEVEQLTPICLSS